MFGFNTYNNANTMEQFLPSDWKKVNHDPIIRVYQNADQHLKAIIACEADGTIRSHDVKKFKDGVWKSIYMYNGFYTNVHSYGDIIFIRSIDNAIEERYGQKTPEWMLFDRKRAERAVYRRYTRKFSHDPFSVPLCNNHKQWRTVSDNDGETCIDFIIIPDNGHTDEEIEDFVHDTVYCYSAYDFPTGRMITTFFSYSRVPCGIAIIHHRGIDW